MGKSSGQDIYEKCEQCLEKSENNKQIWVSYDDPNINLAFLDIWNNKRSDDELITCVLVGFTLSTILLSMVRKSLTVR